MLFDAMHNDVADVDVVTSLTAGQTSSTAGYAECPCASAAGDLPPVNRQEHLAHDPTVNLLTYGVGCKAHDAARSVCHDRNLASPCHGVPPPSSNCPEGSDSTWCNDPWCFVDPAKCDILNSHSSAFPSSGRYFSYATCAAVNRRDIASNPLKGKVLRVSAHAHMP